LGAVRDRDRLDAAGQPRGVLVGLHPGSGPRLRDGPGRFLLPFVPSEPGMNQPIEARTFVEILRSQASRIPEKVAYTFLADGEHARTLTFAQLDERARAIGAWLQQEGQAGERVIVLFSPGLDY